MVSRKEGPRRGFAGLLAVLVVGGILAACTAQPPGQEATPTAPPQATAPPATEPPATEPPAPAALVIQTDTVLGPKNLTPEEKAAKICIQANKFAHNEQVVWRVRVIDGATGSPLDDSALALVEIELPTETLAMKYGPHPAKDPLDYFWTVSWVVPEGYPSGTVPYVVRATGADGRSGSFEQLKIPYAMLTITDEVRVIIPE